MHYKLKKTFFIIIIYIFGAFSVTFGQNKSENVDPFIEEAVSIKDSIRIYLKRIKKFGITKEKYNFVGLNINSDSINNRILIIEQKYNSLKLNSFTDIEKLSALFDEILNYYDMTTDCKYREISKKNKLPKITNEELFKALESELKAIVGSNNFKIKNGELYLIYYVNLKWIKQGEPFYKILVQKTKHDPFFNFYTTHRETIQASAYQQNVFVNYDTILQKLNTMDEEYKERFYKLTLSEIGSLRSSIINKYSAYQSIKSKNPSDSRGDSLFNMITSETVEKFIEDYYKYMPDVKRDTMIEAIRDFVKKAQK